MENEQDNKIYKYKVDSQIENLRCLSYLNGISSVMTVLNDIEIEPFKKFSVAFQAEYWYLKYNLVKFGGVLLRIEDYPALLNEQGLNVISFKIVNNLNVEIIFIDGDCYINIPDKHIDIVDLFEEHLEIKLIKR